jgi:hypothetical protein
MISPYRRRQCNHYLSPRKYLHSLLPPTLTVEDDLYINEGGCSTHFPTRCNDCNKYETHVFIHSLLLIFSIFGICFSKAGLTKFVNRNDNCSFFFTEIWVAEVCAESQHYSGLQNRQEKSYIA